MSGLPPRFQDAGALSLVRCLGLSPTDLLLGREQSAAHATCRGLGLILMWNECYCLDAKMPTE